VLPPIYLRTSQPAEGRSFTLAGLYYGWRRPGYREWGLAPLVRHTRRDGPEGPTTRTSVIPLVYHHRSPRRHTLVTPLVALHSDRDEGLSEGLVGPFGWRRTPALRAMALLPLFFRWTRPLDGERTTLVLPPLWVSHRTPKTRSEVAFPLYWRFDHDGERHLLLFPAYYRQRTADGDATDVAFPLLWRFRNPERDVVVAGPVFWRGERTSPGRTFGLVPVFGYHSDEEQRVLAAAPFFYYRHHLPGGTRTYVAGPAYLHRSRDSYATGLMPIFAHKRTTTGDGYTVLSPAFWHFRPRAGRSTTIVGPAFYDRDGQRHLLGLAPALWVGWRSQGYRLACLVPVGCYLGETGRHALLTAALGFRVTPTRRMWYAGPYYQLRSPSTSIDVLLPLFVHRRDHAGRDSVLWAFPTYYGRWSAQRRVHALLPLVWRSWRPRAQSTVVFPLVWDFDDRASTRTTVVFPLFSRHQDYNAGTVSYITPPGIWIKPHKHGTDAVVFPIVWHFTGRDKQTTTVFPLYWDVRRRDSRTTLLLPVFWRFESPTHRTTVVLNTYYRRGKRERTYDLNVIPLVRVQRKRPTDIKWELLAGLFGYERVGLNRYLKVFLIPFELAPATPQQTTAAIGGQRRIASF